MPTKSKKPRAASARMARGHPSTKGLGRLDPYASLLEQLRTRIRSAQVKAALNVNRELVLLYWEIGRRLLAQQKAEGWGAKVIARLSADLRRSFPDMTGFSPRNLNYMRQFAEAWPRRPFVQQAVAQIPWGHIVRLLEQLSTREEREWYARQTIEHGWSRAILVHHIDTGLHRRQGKALTNFRRALPAPHSELAQQTLKDPYVFDFLTLAKEAQEKDLEKGLLDHVQRFLVELGVGFAFVGRQMRLEVGGSEFFLDLLFYHLRLRCYVVVELKAVPFEPEFAGKLNFYLSAVDEQLRDPTDKPTIGLLLCKAKDRLIVEYALRDMTKPIGVAAWETRIVESLPKQLEGSLPSVEQLEQELASKSE